MKNLKKIAKLPAIFATALAAVIPAFAEPANSTESANSYVQLGTEFNFGINGGPTASEFAVDTVDKYGANWRALRVPLETARSYEESIQPFFTLSLRAGYKNFHMVMDAPLRKDLEAWYQSDLKHNTTYDPANLDINVPINAYGRWDNGAGYVQFGRFDPVDLKVSKNDLAVGGAPFHDGIHWKFAPKIFRYDFFLSSLNGWLFGDAYVPGSDCPAPGTEAFAQKCTERVNQVSNQRNRVYDENQKSYVYHRYGFETSKVWFYLIEQAVVGGKSLELRSISPFMFWHDNFATGFTSSQFTFELGYKPMEGAKFYTQLNLDDINSPVGEDDDKGTTRSILNYLLGYYQEWQTATKGLFSWRLDVVLTDPVTGNSRLPLLKYTSRRVYRSNYRKQNDVDYADTYVVDYPLGYRRGGDALDLWFDFGWKYKSHQLDLTFAWLRQGDKEIYSDYNTALGMESSLSGVVETQYVLDAMYQMKFNNWFSFYVGAGGRIYDNLDHLKGEDGVDGWIRSGVRFKFLPVNLKY